MKSNHPANQCKSSVQGNIVANLTFTLPGANEAFESAVNGARWKQLAVDLRDALVFSEAIAGTVEMRDAFREVLQMLDHNMGKAGLTFATEAFLEEQRKQTRDFREAALGDDQEERPGKKGKPGIAGTS